MLISSQGPQDCFEVRAVISEQRDSVPWVPSWRVALELFYIGGSLTQVTPGPCHAAFFKKGDTEAVLHREESHLCDTCLAA